VGDAKSQDALVIGGGLIGLATAFQLLRTLPHLKVSVLERESRLARAQSGRLPGLIQSELWCGPGLLDAAFCREGRQALERFCEDEGIPWSRCGTLVVAGGEEEEWLRQWQRRAESTGVEAEWWASARLREQVPKLAGASGLFLPESGVVDYEAVCTRLAHRVHELGGEFVGNTEVYSLTESSGEVRVESSGGVYAAKVLFNCAGLQADELARMAGASPELWLVPFRAGFQELDAEGRRWVNRVICRVPRPGALFGSVRLIPSMDGRVECGPSVSPAISRDLRAGWLRAWGDLASQMKFPGFVPMLKRDWPSALREGWRRCRGGNLIDEVRLLFPELEAWHFDEAPSGLFGRALRADGTFEQDLRIVRHGRMQHVCFVPEAGGTAALAIGRTLVSQAVSQLI
jgi:L-2-hydroxyglutarate oxidase